MLPMYRKFIGDRAFYRRALMVAIPILVQNAITQFVALLDNIMVGQVGTAQMSGVAIVNNLIFVFNLCIFGANSGAGIFTAQFHGSQDPVLRSELPADHGAGSAALCPVLRLLQYPS